MPSFMAPALYPWRLVRRRQLMLTPRPFHSATCSSTSSLVLESVESSSTWTWSLDGSQLSSQQQSMIA